MNYFHLQGFLKNDNEGMIQYLKLCFVRLAKYLKWWSKLVYSANYAYFV